MWAYVVSDFSVNTVPQTIAEIAGILLELFANLQKCINVL